MALVSCPECGKEKISDQANACPDCGFPIAIHFKEIENKRIQEEREQESRKQAQIKRQLEKEQQEKIEKGRELLNLLAGFEKIYDWRDVTELNKSVVEDLRKNLKTDYPVTFVTTDNLSDCVENVKEGKYSYPYVVVSAVFNYSFGVYDRYLARKKDGSTFYKYYDELQIPALYAPQFHVFSSDKTQVEDIANKIKSLYSEEAPIYSADFMNPDLEVTVFCKIDTVGQIQKLADYDNRELYYTNLESIKTLVPSCMDTHKNKIGDQTKAIFRLAQLAQCCVLYIEKKKDCDREIKNEYGRLFKKEGILKQMGSLLYSKEYNELSNKIKMGQEFSVELVEKSFPSIVLVYHDLPNDLVNKTPAESLQQRLNDIFNIFIKYRNDICNSLGLPRKLNITNASLAGHENSMWGNEGLTYVVTALVENPTRKISDIVNDYIEMVEVAVEEYEIQKEQEREEREAQREANGGSSSFLGTMAGSFLGSKMAGKSNNHGGIGVTEKNGKGHFKGMAGCAKSRGKNCYDCGLYWDCLDR